MSTIGRRHRVTARRSPHWPDTPTSRKRLSLVRFMITRARGARARRGWFLPAVGSRRRGHSRRGAPHTRAVHAKVARRSSSAANCGSRRCRPADLSSGAARARDGDFARSQRFSTRPSASRHRARSRRREGLTLLAQGNPDARALLRAPVEIDPPDRLAQGFLACSLHRLGRFDDARAGWNERARGGWTPALDDAVMPVPPGAMNPPLPPAPPR